MDLYSFRTSRISEASQQNILIFDNHCQHNHVIFICRYSSLRSQHKRFFKKQPSLIEQHFATPLIKAGKAQNKTVAHKKSASLSLTKTSQNEAIKSPVQTTPYLFVIFVNPSPCFYSFIRHFATLYIFLRFFKITY